MKSSTAPLRVMRTWQCPRCLARRSLRFLSTDSTETAPPPLLSKIRNDLKTAMRARDTARCFLGLGNGSSLPLTLLQTQCPPLSHLRDFQCRQDLVSVQDRHPNACHAPETRSVIQSSSVRV